MNPLIVLSIVLAVLIAVNLWWRQASRHHCATKKVMIQRKQENGKI
jgi:hypothetical protein